MAYADEDRTANMIGVALKQALLDYDADSAPDADAFDEASLNADTDINIRLAQRYVMPITGTVPDDIKTIAAQLTVGHFCLMRHPETAKIYRDMALESLELIASGDGDVPGLTPVGAASGRVGLSSQQLTPVFGMRTTDDDTDDTANTDRYDPTDGVF